MSDVAREGLEEHTRAPTAPLRSLLLVLALPGLVALSSALRSGQDRPSGAQCQALLAHFVDVASRARDPSVRPEAVAAQQQSVLQRPAAKRDVAACERGLTEGEVRCALGTSNVDDLERCLP